MIVMPACYWRIGSTHGPEIAPFRIEVPEAELADLGRRLRQTRWPDPAPVPSVTKTVVRPEFCSA
jgi:hypothetical protein